jgi:hypothetical protein
MARLEKIAFALILAAASTPAFAGTVAPAPVAGVGIGAVMLLGLGYRALKRHRDQ